MPKGRSLQSAEKARLGLDGEKATPSGFRVSGNIRVTICLIHIASQ